MTPIPFNAPFMVTTRPSPMAFSSSCNPQIFIVLATFATILLGARPSSSCYTAIFSFGDSLADTGNALRLGQHVGPAGKLPFGMTYFNQATGRFSNGRVMIDFIAQKLGLPLVRPYLAGGEGKEFLYGANFAVAGATALDLGFFREKGMQASFTEYNLGGQLEWFKKLLPTIPFGTDINETLSKSLILMGEIGGNDYNHAFFQRKSLEMIRTFVPKVVEAIGSAINTLVELGARTMLVPGNFPIGCVPWYLVIYHSEKAEDYDSAGCLKWLNEFSEYHNRMLLDELARLRKIHPQVTIIYGNYYDAAMSIFKLPQLFGFKETMRACCGGDAPYGMDWSAACGSGKAKVCGEISRYLSWDGLHLTEAAYGTIAGSLLEGPHASPSLLQACPGAIDDF